MTKHHSDSQIMALHYPGHIILPTGKNKDSRDRIIREYAIGLR